MEKVIMYRNKDERVAVMKKLDKMGYKWNPGIPIKELNPTEYDDVGGGISLHDTNKTIMYSNVGYYKRDSYLYELIPARNFLNDKIKPIVICRKGRTVIAEDKTTGDKGVAVCSPDDEFDFYTGAAIALARLIDDCAISDDVKAEWKKRFGEEPETDTDEIKVGDTVMVVDKCDCYSMYDTWVKDNVTNINDCIHYCYKKSIPAEEFHRYTVIAIGPHCRNSKETLYYIKNTATEECFLMGKCGIEKA